jgi:phage-related protein
MHFVDFRTDCITKSNATTPLISPVVTQVDVIIQDAVKAVEGLALKPIEDVLIGTDGVLLTVDAVLVLLYAILEVVFKALKAVLDVVEDVTELLEILTIVM